MGLRAIKATATQRADRVSLCYCESCAVWHMLLFKNGNEQAFAECSFTCEALSNLIDDDVARRKTGEPIPMTH